MNKKGFTLVEIIIVLAIISVLSLILTPSVIKLIDKNNEKSCNGLKNNIISAAKVYVSDNRYELNVSCNTSFSIPLQTLIDSGDLNLDKNEKITNPITKDELPLTSEITVIYSCSSKQFTYDYNLNCGS